MSHIAVSTHEIREVRHNVVVDHDPPILVQNGNRKVQIERTVFLAKIKYGEPVKHLYHAHYAHYVKADGSIGAERKNYWLSSHSAPEAHALLKAIEADALARAQAANDAYLTQNNEHVRID